MSDFSLPKAILEWVSFSLVHVTTYFFTLLATINLTVTTPQKVMTIVPARRLGSIN